MNVAKPVDWIRLVENIRAGDLSAMEELYRIFHRGIRFFLCRKLGTQNFEDQIHDTFVIVVQAIRRGELREPERLMGYVRTVVRRQAAAHIGQIVRNRCEVVEFDDDVQLADIRNSPEQIAIVDEHTKLMERVLGGLKPRNREILIRFYLQEQSQEQIRQEMGLSETQFRLLKSRARQRFGELGRQKLLERRQPQSENLVRKSAVA